MSRLEKLIAELCPDGVEYKTIADIALDMYRGSGVRRDQVRSSGVPCVRYGEIYTTYGTWFEECVSYVDETAIPNSKYFSHGDILFAITGESVEEIAKSTAYVGNDECIAGGDIVVLKHNQDPKYLSYALSTTNAQSQKSKGRVKSKVVHSNIPAIKTIEVPIPPLPVQREIVRILDHFTELTEELTAKLTAELAARQKQYEYYRDLLLTFDDSVPRYSLGKIARYSVTRVQASEVDKHSYIGVDNLLPDKRGKTSSSYVPEQGTVIEYLKGNILIGNIRPYLKKIWLATHHGGTNGDVLVIQIKEGSTRDLTPQFLYHVLSSEAFFHFNTKHSRGAKMPRGDKRAIMNFPIPLPPLAEQERIVGILDRFDALVNDLTSGLPAEIEARRKQYEYYRDKLLTFKEATP